MEDSTSQSSSAKNIIRKVLKKSKKYLHNGNEESVIEHFFISQIFIIKCDSGISSMTW